MAVGAAGQCDYQSRGALKSECWCVLGIVSMMGIPVEVEGFVGCEHELDNLGDPSMHRPEHRFATDFV